VSDVELNREWWDERAALHGDDRVYDVEGFVAGGSTLQQRWLEAVGDPAGQRLVHLQCHTGMDTLSWLRAGASAVVGVDFSAVAVAKAAETAQRAGLADRAEFVESDVCAVPARLHRSFDIAFANIGAICWIGDIGAWMRTAAAVLVPGGRLVLVEIHPLYNMANDLDPLRLDMPYVNDGVRRFDDANGSYAVPEAVTRNNTVLQWAHSLGEVVTAAVDAGLVVRRLVEHVDAESDGRGQMAREDDGRFRWRLSGQAMPVEFTLVATKP
jgi:SAM-dependent methyltransferase